MAKKLMTRNRVGLATGAAALGLTIAALSVSVVSPAEAIENRRLCVYSHVYEEHEETYTDDTAKTVFVNYKKNGRCPQVDPRKFKNKVGMDLGFNQPVRKIVCEAGSYFILRNTGSVDPELAKVWGQNSSDDLCGKMEADVVYLFTWSDVDGTKSRKLGSVYDLAP